MSLSSTGRVELDSRLYFARLRRGPELQLVLCTLCRGLGELEMDCERCGGTGEVDCRCWGCGVHHMCKCNACDGQGAVDGECMACGGAGYRDEDAAAAPPCRRTLPLFIAEARC